jgi:hypothetical protein
MTQSQLNLAVANRTRESLATVRSIGFSALKALSASHEPDDIALRLECPFCRAPIDLAGARRSLAECDACDIEFEYDEQEVFVGVARSVSQAGS